MKVKGMAHRGYKSKYPENTITAFKAAYELGFSHLELDVQLSKDGVAVVMHDTTVDRMTDAAGAIKDFTFTELRELKVGGTEKIPTLAEALLYAKDKMIVSIELKQQGDLYEGLEAETLKIIEETDMMDQVYANSFDHFSVIKMRELSDDIELGLIQPGATPAVFPLMKDIRATYLSVKVEFLTDAFVAMCESRDIQIVAWPINHAWQFEKVSRYPSIISTTDYLERFKTWSLEHNQSSK